MASLSGRGKGDEHETPNTMVYHPRYDNAHWKGLHEQAGAMCIVIKRTMDLGLDLPPPPGIDEGSMPFVSYKGPFATCDEEGWGNTCPTPSGATGIC